MLYFDIPRIIIFHGKERLATHLISDVSLTELHHFAKKIGVPDRAFHNKPNRPHYDLFDNFIEKAIETGAKEITTKSLIIMLKRIYSYIKYNK